MIERAKWCGKGWTLRAYTWRGRLYAALYRGHSRCRLGVLEFANREELDLLASSLGATLVLLTGSDEPVIRVLETQVPHEVPKVVNSTSQYDEPLRGRYNWPNGEMPEPQITGSDRHFEPQDVAYGPNDLREE